VFSCTSFFVSQNADILIIWHPYINCFFASCINELFRTFVCISDFSATRHAFEEAMAVCENGTHALAFASGSAVTATIASFFKPGDHLLVCDDVLVEYKNN
jgi:cysteine-S-conjugate beta-lyase